MNVNGTIRPDGLIIHITYKNTVKTYQGNMITRVFEIYEAVRNNP